MTEAAILKSRWNFVYRNPFIWRSHLNSIDSVARKCIRSIIETFYEYIDFLSAIVNLDYRNYIDKIYKLGKIDRCKPEEYLNIRLSIILINLNVQ